VVLVKHSAPGVSRWWTHRWVYWRDGDTAGRGSWSQPSRKAPRL